MTAYILFLSGRLCIPAESLLDVCQRSLKSGAPSGSSGMGVCHSIEAVMAKTNGPSNRLAARLLSTKPADGNDSFSGEPIFQYLKLIS